MEREILEELSISVSAIDEVARISHRYEDRIVDLRIIDCGVVDPNSIILMEHDMSRWLEKDELDDVNWLPADLPIITEWMNEGTLSYFLRFETQTDELPSSFIEESSFGYRGYSSLPW